MRRHASDLAWRPIIKDGDIDEIVVAMDKEEANIDIGGPRFEPSLSTQKYEYKKTIEGWRWHFLFEDTVQDAKQIKIFAGGQLQLTSNRTASRACQGRAPSSLLRDPLGSFSARWRSN